MLPQNLYINRLERRVLFINEKYVNISETFINRINDGIEGEKFAVFSEMTDSFSYSYLSGYEKITLVPKNILDHIVSFSLRFIFKSQYHYSILTYIQIIFKIIFQFKPDVIVAHYGPNGIRISPLIKLLGIPCICIFHGYDLSRLLNSKAYVQDLKKLNNKLFRMIVVSEAMRSTYVKLNFNKSSVSLIHYGVDIDKIARIETKRRQKNIIKILHVGRLTPKKGVPDLIKVFIETSCQLGDRIQLEIIGDGSDMEECLNLIKINQYDNIKISGVKDNKYVIQAMKESDIYILNSRIAEDGDSEGFPNTILEAMASKCAIVSTNHSGISEAITEDCGFLVDPYDNKALKSALIRLVDDESLRNKIIANAYVRVKTLYSNQLMIEKYNNVVVELLNAT